jgi:2-polyprenyl-3-methyl-5-hydroxy-6-metoxy-1,4-benzoquinol methylase
MLSVRFSGSQSQCKICASPASIYGVVDFNKNCLENRDVFLPLVGVPVYYHQCEKCRLIFSNAFDDWTTADYQRHIYNSDYVKVDPDYVEARPRQLADMVFNFIKRGDGLQLLDYGGGSGLMAELLRQKGVAATSWDPMTANPLPDKHHFDVVTCFEVFEHTASPTATAKSALGLLGRNGVLLFSTLTADALPPREVGFWYIAPRNGHITIYSKKSLRTLFAKFGYKTHHFNDNVHMAYQELPAWVTSERPHAAERS